MHDFFGPVISSYTRADAISEGVLIDLSSRFPDQCSMYRYPISCTSAVWTLIEQGAASGNGISLASIVWDILNMSQHCVVNSDDQTVFFEVIISGAGCHRLKALCHPGDYLEPVITFMLPDED